MLIDGETSKLLPNVAAHFTSVLGAQGWNMKPPEDTQTAVAKTNIYYEAGYVPSADEIAASLGVPVSSVVPLTTSVPVSNTESANVVVIIGADLAGSGFPATTT